MRVALYYLFFLGLLFKAGSLHATLPAYDSSGRALPSLSPMLKQVNPAVVNIATFSKKQSYNPLLNDPFFRRFFNLPDEQPREQAPTKRQQSAGSGVIVDAKKGLVITNYHVIKGADEVQVSLEDGRVFTADIEGSDPDLDIAILKIKAKNLKEVPIADSNQVLVGDFVVAIGNPFGLGQTVTTGIVSALGRSGLGMGDMYENFIQTDASINPGNSGGALVNLRGELVGINTAIIAPSGGNVGIGFAIPINMAKASLDQIVEYGEVRRGRIGVQIQDLTRELRQQFGLKNGQQGVLIAGVQPDSQAEKARLRSGDIVTAVDGERVSSTGQLRSQISIKSIGDKVDLTVIRNGKEKLFKVGVGDPISPFSSGENVHPLLEGAQFNDNSGEGVTVVSMAPNSPAMYSGLREGDVILGVNRKKVDGLRSFRSAVRDSGDSILLHVERDGRSFYVVIQ